MIEAEHEEQEAFRDTVSCVGEAWAQTSRLSLRRLSDQQHRATSALAKSLARFTLSLKAEFARQPLAKTPAAAREQVARDLTHGSPKTKPVNPHDQTVKAIGFVWRALSDLLAMPNRLNTEQRELAFAVLEAIHDFVLVDFRDVTPMESIAA